MFYLPIQFELNLVLTKNDKCNMNMTSIRRTPSQSELTPYKI